MAKATASTALAVIDPKDYVIMDPANNTAGLMLANLGGEDISEFDLDQVKVPAGGGTAWKVPTINGPKNMDEIEGIIVHVGKRRQYWPGKNPTGEPPACQSRDLIKGIGKPGGDCEACPHNQFGSGTKADGSQGAGKACKESRVIFLLRKEDHLPIVISVPPGSLKNFKKFLLRLPAPKHQVITRLTLETDKNSDGISYSQVVPTVVQVLPADLAPRISEYASQLAKVFG